MTAVVVDKENSEDREKNGSRISFYLVVSNPWSLCKNIFPRKWKLAISLIIFIEIKSLSHFTRVMVGNKTTFPHLPFINELDCIEL